MTGLKVDTYVMLNLNGFKDFVDALDGVTVDVHERLPIGGNSKTMVATGGYIEIGDNQKLDGYHASGSPGPAGPPVTTTACSVSVV